MYIHDTPHARYSLLMTVSASNCISKENFTKIGDSRVCTDTSKLSVAHLTAEN